MSDFLLTYHSLLNIPFYVFLIYIIYIKFLKTFNDNAEFYYTKMDEDSYLPILLIIGLMSYTIFINMLTLFSSIGNGDAAFLWVRNFVFVIPIISVCILILFIRHKFITKKYKINFQIEEINKAIKNSSDSQVREILQEAKYKIMKQIEMKDIAKGIAAATKLQESLDYVDVQFEVDKLEAYLKLEE